MTNKNAFALALISAATFITSGCTTPANCPTCGTTQNGTVVAIGVMRVPQASPFGKPFAVWDLVTQDPVNRRLYVTDRSHAAIAIFDTATDKPIGQVKHGFVGSVCCEPDRASNFNEASGPNGAIVTPSTTGGKLGNLWVSDGDSTLKVFNLDTDTLPVDHNDGTAKQSFGTVQTGRSLTNIDDCARGTNVSADPTGNPCGDLRADEPSFDSDHNRLIVTNGDGPNGAFVTLVDTTNPTCAGNSCVLAQYFFDGGGDTATTGCPDPAVSGVTTGAVKCRHVGNNPATENATNGLGGSIYNPGTKKFLQGVPQIGPNPNDGEVTEIDPVTFAVTNHFRLTAATGAPGCQVASLALGPSQNLLIGCANREGEAFPPSTFIMDVSAAGKGKIIKAIYNVGRADQVIYNPGDNRFYLGARDMENGSFLGIIDASTNMWLYNSPTGGNAHGLAADAVNNHIYVPIAQNARCGQFSAEGCITIYASQ
ncbi:MAG: hypothetical protein E6J78_11485 [Deltaproteobacteria bacterium]|nr:MAG: hypothetical protein E6J78_11485 [Deltaproteobacteria bacterium]